ncbi:MAG: ProQ/FINO family protein [Burkholderiaceae bacterium]
MTTTPSPDSISVPETESAPQAAPAAPARVDRRQAAQPVLEKLFELYPALFGAQFLPLKLGVYQELLASHPEQFEKESLKAALAVHTRSTPYLNSMAEGHDRHDLQGQAVEAVAPEHVFLAIVELFRRRQLRTPQDLSPKLKSRLLAAFEAGGLSRQDYLAKIPASPASALLEQALDQREAHLAKQEALRRAFQASDRTPEDFAQMYGLDPHAVRAMLKT